MYSAGRGHWENIKFAYAGIFVWFAHLANLSVPSLESGLSQLTDTAQCISLQRETFRAA